VLPIVQRELRVSARNPKLYARRVRWGVLQIIVACAALLMSGGGFQTRAAQSFFNTLCGFALLFCLLEGIHKTSDAISSEKREGTLGFLFLSTLSGADVTLGKFCGALIRSLSALLPFLPILALTLLVGGTTLGEFWRVALALAVTLLLSLGICLFISSVTKTKSIGAALAALVVLCVTPFLAVLTPARFQWLSLLSPWELLRAAKEWPYTRSPMNFWIGVGLAVLGSVMGIVGASFFVTRTWQQRGATITEGVVRGRRSRKRRELLDKNPVLWLNYDQRGGVVFSTVAVLLFAVGVPGLLMAVVDGSDLWIGLASVSGTVLCLAIWLRVGVQASTWLAEAKRDGSLELLLTTPLSVNEMIRGYRLALWRMIRVPVFCFLPFFLALIVASGRGGGASSPISTGSFALYIPLTTVTLATVGMWMGLTAKNRPTAVVLTLLLGWLAPSILFCLAVPAQVVLTLRAHDRVKTILHRMRMGSDPSDLRTLLRIPGRSNCGVPPVIRQAEPPVIR
jgi:ABC-type transport system involved in multi-copper enzyme maturation permease subunit